MDKKKLKKVADKLRIDIVDMIYKAKSGHPGGSLSCIDILTYLYYEVMTVDPANPKLSSRDRFVLSKGHAAPALYSILAENGFFSREELNNLRKSGALLQGHPDSKNIPGVDISTGSLGQGISNSIGMALGAKLDKNNINIYVLLGDGELQEGLVWEAIMAAAHYKLDNLIAIVDYNGLQIDGENEKVMGIAPLKEKWHSFGWNTLCIDGHDFDAMAEAFESAKAYKEKPTVIIAKTIKGKGVSFMENNAGWHGKAPSIEEKNRAIEELKKSLTEEVI